LELTEKEKKAAIAAYKKQWRIDNPDKVKEQDARKREKIVAQRPEGWVDGRTTKKLSEEQRVKNRRRVERNWRDNNREQHLEGQRTRSKRYTDVTKSASEMENWLLPRTGKAGTRNTSLSTRVLTSLNANSRTSGSGLPAT
jgi:hypothetical protein